MGKKRLLNLRCSREKKRNSKEEEYKNGGDIKLKGFPSQDALGQSGVMSYCNLNNHADHFPPSLSQSLPVPLSLSQSLPVPSSDGASRGPWC